MCGIAGLMNLQGAPVDAALLRRMAERIAHRGPDALGVETLGAVGLAHVRLSIVDLAGGAQPMANQDRTLWITFNGEILNFVELRAELMRAGHRFATRSDTEVVLHAYEEWGPGCVDRFNGQWAFVVYDTRTRALFASRDRFGIRPLYYTLVRDQFVFASEVKALFCHPSVPRAIDLEGLDQIFTFWCTLPPRTAFAGIHELPAGHSMMVENGALRRWRYFHLDYPPPDGSRSAADLAEELRACLADGVRLRLTRADVPVGAYLSGGLDSTVVTSMVKNLTDSPITTFSLAFADAEYDESRFQAEVVDHLGLAEHHIVRCLDQDIGRVFPDVMWHAEAPIVRTAPAPMYLLARLVRQRGYKVVLTGEGSDELLGGYDIFKEAKIRRFCARQPGSRLRPLLLKRLYPYLTRLQHQPPEYLQAFFRVRPEDLASPFFSHLPRWELTARVKRFYSAEVRQQLAAREPYAELSAALPPAFADWDPFCQAQYLETAHLLPGYILSSQGDRMAMAHGVEGRFPFLDVRVAELAARIPATLKMKALDEKHILKQATRDLLPPFLRRRKKQPYRAPAAGAFFDPATGRARFAYVAELLAPEAIARGGLFDAGAVARLVDKARSGQLVGVKDELSLVGILATQLTLAQLIDDGGRLSP